MSKNLTEKKWDRLTKWLEPKDKDLESWRKWMRYKGKGAYIKTLYGESCVMVYQRWAISEK